jgi:hypothetical protein
MSVIKSDEHVFIAGGTGSGKTYLAEQYMNGFSNVIVLDTKGFFSWESSEEDIPVFTSLEDIMKFGEGKAIYRPNFEELTQEFYNSFLEWIYKRGNTVVVIDELMEVAPSPSTYPPYLKGILTRGRQKNVSCWCLTQRPKDIPIIAMSEATHFFIFRLNFPDDRERIAKIVGFDEVLDPPGNFAQYRFWYFNAKKTERPVKAVLGK